MKNYLRINKLICDKASLLASKGHMSRTCQGASPTRLTLLPIFLQSNESGARMLSQLSSSTNRPLLQTYLCCNAIDYAESIVVLFGLVYSNWQSHRGKIRYEILITGRDYIVRGDGPRKPTHVKPIIETCKICGHPMEQGRRLNYIGYRFFAFLLPCFHVTMKNDTFNLVNFTIGDLKPPLLVISHYSLAPFATAELYGTNFHHQSYTVNLIDWSNITMLNVNSI